MDGWLRLEYRRWTLEGGKERFKEVLAEFAIDKLRDSPGEKYVCSHARSKFKKSAEINDTFLLKRSRDKMKQNICADPFVFPHPW